MIDNKDIIIKTELKWSNSYKWINLASGKISVPNSPGVYEVIAENGESLHIGMAGDLNRRLLKQLTGKGKHSTRDRIKEDLDLSNLKIRWALTKYPAAVEEYLHNNYKTKYSKIKKYLI